MKELQGQAERLQHKNDKLLAQIEKSLKDVQDNDRNVQSITRDKGKGPVVPDDFDTPTNDELSSSNFSSLNLSPVKNTRESTRTRSGKRPSPHPTFSDAISGASRRERRGAGKTQYRLGPAQRNPPVLPSGTLPPASPVHPAFGTTPIFYVAPTYWPSTKEAIIGSNKLF